METNEFDELLSNLKEEYYKKRGDFLLARNIKYNHIDSTSIRIIAKILDESVEIPVDKYLLCELMESTVNYYKKQYYEIGDKIRSITCNTLKETKEDISNLNLLRKNIMKLYDLIDEELNAMSDDVIIRHLERKGYKVSK